MNFEWGTKLAERQDRVIAALLADGFPSAEDFDKIRGNAAVPLAAVLCPCNLTVRHYCLKAVLRNTTQYHDKILRQCELLARGGMWLEGYSYWSYTRPALCLYADAFKHDDVLGFIWRQDGYFSQTWYRVCGRLYPALFGDLWPDPLECQTARERAAVKPVTYLAEGFMEIHSRAVRFNLHTENKKVTYFFDETWRGFPVDVRTGKLFKFYEGYKKKYPTVRAEFWAIVKRFFLLASGRNR